MKSGALADIQNTRSNLGSVTLSSSPLISKTTAVTDVSPGCGSSSCLAVWPTRSHPKLLLPINNLAAARQGLNLYQPYSWAGKLSKGLLERVIGLSALRFWSRGAVSIRPETLAELKAIVLTVTGEKRPHFALLHGGTYESSRLTAQVMRPDGEILGYLKFPFTPDQADRIRHETHSLQRLWSFVDLRRHIPQVLFAGEQGGLYLAFFSPLPGKTGPTDITSAHEQMLSSLRNADPVEVPGSVLVEDVYRSWDEVHGEVSSELLRQRDAVLKICSDNIGRVPIRCGISHGDFAPWNTRIHDGRLAAFDWEASCWNAPAQWDVFHFYIQVAVCLNRARRKKLRFNHPNEGSLLLLYLLNSIPQLLTKSTRRNLQYRTRLLKTQVSSPHRDEFWIA